MSVSEQAPNQDVLADHTPGASTFPGTPTSGGWIPILSQPKEGGRPFISDWICPVCKRLTSQSRSCPHCGLRIKETPRIKPKEPLQKGKRVYLYRDWEEAEYHAPKKRTAKSSDRPLRPQLRRPVGSGARP